MLVIGDDPDAEKHGVAIYRDGKLVGLAMWNIIDWLRFLEKEKPDYVSIEDVQANKPTFSKKGDGTLQKKLKIAQNVGQCKQAQRELMRVLDYYEIPYFLTKPTRGNWANNKAFFEKVTGWKKNSNVDTRSAAYFGFIALKFYKPEKK